MPVGNSLQDQLLKAGLVNTQQLKQTKTEKRKENRQSHGHSPAQSESRQRLQAEVAEKARRDRELNLKRQEELRRREEENSIRQLIHAHRLSRAGGEFAFNFQDGGRLRRLYLTPEQQRSLVAGHLARGALVAPLPQRVRLPHALRLWPARPLRAGSPVAQVARALLP